MEKHDTLLIACTNAETRTHLRFILDEHYNLLETATLRQTLLLLEQNAECIAAVLMTADVFTEFEHINDDNYKDIFNQFPVIVITEKAELEKASIFFRSGAADVIPVGYAPYAMIHRIENLTQLYLHRQHLESVIREQKELIRRSNDTLVDALSSIIEYRSVESGHHVHRVRYYTKIVLEEVMRICPEYNLDEQSIAKIASASALHDIGKIAVPDAILLKPGPLTDDEWAIMRTHSLTGCNILETLEDMADKEYLRYAHNICHYHHERWDGNGYPEGLSGEDIPICAQVVGIADVFEALTSKRVYKDAFPPDRAINMIVKGECGAFSPKLLECFKNVSLQLIDIVNQHSDENDDLQDKPFDMTLPVVDAEKTENSLDLIRAKYYALVHHVGGFLIEINKDKNVFHVVYNPYPALLPLENITSLKQLTKLFLNNLVVPEEREEMENLIRYGIDQFLDEHMRHTTHYFHFNSKNKKEPSLASLTMLRINPTGVRRSLAIILKVVDTKKETSPEPVKYTLADGNYICKNDPYFTLVHFGKDNSSLGAYSSKEIEELFHNHLSELIHPDDREMVRREFSRQLEKSSVVNVEHRIILKGGRSVWVANKSMLIKGENDEEYIHSFLTNINATRLAFEELKEKHKKYINVLSKTQNILFIWDIKNNIFDVSDTWDCMFSFPAPTKDLTEYVTKYSHIHPDDVPLLLDKLNGLETSLNVTYVEVRISTDKGVYKWYRFRGNAERDENGNLTQVVGSIAEVDAEKRKENDLQQKAEQDSLTLLLNKEAGKRHVENYLKRYPQGADCTMLILDLDNFKQVNDKYGHLFGDAVLKQFADEIRNQFRGHDIMCRIGGDEFMVLVRGLSSRETLKSKCRSFIDSLIVGGQYKKFKLSCSIGIAISPEHGTSYNDLFNHADQALYQAKAGGKNDFHFYEPENNAFPMQPIRMTAVNTNIDSDVETGLADDNIVHQAFQRLYTAKNVEEAVNELISSLGKKMNVSRVYIFENSDDNKFCHNTFEWCNEGISPEIGNLQNISYETDIPNYDKNFNEQGVFYCPDINTQPKHIYDIVAPQGIKSMLHCAIRQDGVFRGYIGFDECVQQRLWTKHEIDMLTFFSEILSVFLQKYREQQKIQGYTEDMETILNNQNAQIYIVDPETYELKYFNKRIANDYPNANVGDICYKCFRNSSSPCSTCPICNAKNDAVRFMVSDRKTKESFLIEATPVNWGGNENCMVSLRSMSNNNILII